MADADVVNAGVVFADLVEKELAAERERRESLNTRGAGILTTSSALVTLIFALGALVTGVDSFELSDFSLAMLLAALVAFLIAALLGLLANRLQGYQVIEPAQLLDWRDRDGAWNDTADKARRVIVLANIKTIESLRLGNNSKASLIEVAFVVQLVAVAFLAVTIGGAIQSS